MTDTVKNEQKTYLVDFSSMISRLPVPLPILLGIVILFFSFFSLKEYIGSTWETGTFSFVLIPFLGKYVAPFFPETDSLITSSLVLLGTVLGPVVFYFFVYTLTKRVTMAFSTGLLSLLPAFPLSPTPSSRFVLALVEKDGAHVVGFTFVPLITLIFLRFLRYERRQDVYLVVLGGVVTSLISLFALFFLLIFMVTTTISEMLIGQGKIKLRRFSVSSCLLIVLVALLYNISFVRILASEEGSKIVAVLSNLVPLSFFIVPIFGTFAFLLFERRAELQSVFLSLTLFLVVGLLSYIEGSLIDSMVTDTNRYEIELSLVRSFFVSLVLSSFIRIIKQGQLTKTIPQLHQLRYEIGFGILIITYLVLSALVLFIPRSL